MGLIEKKKHINSNKKSVQIAYASIMGLMVDKYASISSTVTFTCIAHIH